MTAARSTHLALGGGAEFDIVRALVERWGTASFGTGDDAALLDVPAGRHLVVSTDSSVEHVHFRRDWLSAEEIGYRAAAAAISDLAAMGATPLAMTIALTLPERWRSQITAIADGIAQAARATGTPIVGGDLTSGGELSFSITVLGTAVRPLLRSGARTGDTVWVTGRLGGPRLALASYERGTVPSGALRERFARPVPRLREARWLAAHGATAAIDCSDGIAADLNHVAAASRKRIVLHLESLPRIAGATDEDAARSGEEYEVIATGPTSLDAAAFEREFSVPLTAVGTVEDLGAAGPGVDAFRHGVPVALPHGHDHFAS